MTKLTFPAERRLKGILARDHTAEEIRDLLNAYYWERRNAADPGRVPVGGPDHLVHLCLHPHQRQEYRTVEGHWAKRRRGTGWRMRWVPPHAYWRRSCPDCPATEYLAQTDLGWPMLTSTWMAPWYVGPRKETA